MNSHATRAILFGASGLGFSLSGVFAVMEHDMSVWTTIANLGGLTLLALALFYLYLMKTRFSREDTLKLMAAASEERKDARKERERLADAITHNTAVLHKIADRLHVPPPTEKKA